MVSLLLPFLSYSLLRLTTNLDRPTAAAVAAHYGSISMVTFATATAFLKSHEIAYAGYIVAILALMEAPAILSGLFIAHKTTPETRTHKNEETKLSCEIFTNGAILLLLGAFLIGWITGQPGFDKVSGFLDAPFQGILCLFLLDMGLLVAKNLHHLRSFTWRLIAFGIYMPIIGAGFGLGISYVLVSMWGRACYSLCCVAAHHISPYLRPCALPCQKPRLRFMCR